MTATPSFCFPLPASAVSATPDRGEGHPKPGPCRIRCRETSSDLSRPREVVCSEVVARRLPFCTGIAVNQGLGQARHFVEKPVVGHFGDGMGLGEGQLAVRDDGRLGQQRMAHPADAHSFHLIYAVNPGEDPLALVDQRRRASSSQSVPAASDISVQRPPVR